MITRFVFLACLAATLAMTGLIWFVQVVHYPLLEKVGTADFPAYHADHTRLTGRVVFVPMVVELLSSAWLVWDRPRGLTLTLAILGLLAALVTWAVTAVHSVPAHNHLSRGFDPAWQQSLVAVNWLRTSAWTIHAFILLVAVSRQMD